MKFIYHFCFILILFQFIETKLNPDVLFSDNDKEKFLNLFQLPEPINDNQLSNIYFSVFGLNLLDSNSLKSFLEKHNKNKICDLTKQFINKENAKNIENIYYATSIQKIIGCQINSNELASLVEPEINSALSIQNLFKAAVILENASKPLPVAKISKLLNEALVKDDSFLSSGFALQLATKLSKNDITNYANKISNLISQADEVDEKYLQYEGGLGVTASIIKGVIQLSEAANKDSSLKNLEVVKFSNYFLNRLSVQTSKGASELLEILKILSTNKFFIPVVVSRYSSNIVSDKNNFVIKVTNVLGQSLNKEFSVTLKIDDSNEVKMNPVQGDSTLYAVNLMESLKQKPGKYNAIINLKPTKLDKALMISNDINFDVVFQSKISLDSIEISVGEKDQLALKYEPVEYPISLSKALDCDSNQKISIKFCVRDLLQSKDISTQQAFIQFVNQETKDVINFVADQDRISKVYIKDINLAYKGKEFNFESGVYNINLIAGDSLVSNPINWNLGKIKLQFSQDPISDESNLNYIPKPEIKHQFREPEKRPPVLVSHTFTLLCLAPILILFVSWFKIGLNLSNFSFSLSALLFHSSLALIFVLYTLFFINMNMFTTVKCLSGVLITAFLSGHYLLKNLANKSVDSSTKKTN